MQISARFVAYIYEAEDWLAEWPGPRRKAKEVEMRPNSPTDKLASQQLQAGPGREAWWREEMKFEIERLKALLRDPAVSAEERAIAQSQVANYREMSGTDANASDWLKQMCLLGDQSGEPRSTRKRPSHKYVLKRSA